MAVAIVGTPLAINDGTSYTAEAGSDRVVVVVVGVTEFNSVTFAPTFGGQAFTQGTFIEGTDRSYAYIGYIKEADIPAGSNAFALNPSGAVDATDGTIYTLSGVDQTTVGSGFTLDDSPGSATPVLNITGVADGVAVAVHTKENSGIQSADPSWTARSLNAGTATQRVHTADKTTTAGADTFEPGNTIAGEGVLASFVFNAASAGLAIDTIPTTINADSSFNVVVSNPTTAPTTGNTTIKFTNASGQAATINSVTGTGPYTINATFPRATTDAFFGSYSLYVVVDAENATSGGTASYEPSTGWSYVDVGTIDTSSEIYTQYSAGTIATGWQAVIKSPTNEDSVTVTMTDDLNYTFGPYTGSTNQTTEFYAINASQTVLAEETITFDFGAGSSSGVQLVKNIVQDIITDISSDMVG